MRFFHALFILLLLGFPLSVKGADQEERPHPPQPADLHIGMELKVLWTVSFYHIGKNATLSENEAKNMLFKPLHIDASSITFAGQSCRNITFQSETVDTLPYLSSKYQVEPQVLGYKGATVKVVRTNCQLEGFSEYIRLADRRLVVSIQGVLFIFAPRMDY